MYSYSSRGLCLVSRQWRMSVRSLILGLETSCDDTGVAVIDQSGQVLSQSLHSQASVRMGGVIPSFALNSHAASIHSLVTEVLDKAKIRADQLEAVAVSKVASERLRCFFYFRLNSYFSRFHFYFDFTMIGITFITFLIG